MAVGVAVVAAILVISLLTQSNTNTTVNDLSNVSTAHGQTINKIHTLAVQFKAQEKRLNALVDEVHAFQLAQAQGDTEVGQILIKAGNEVTALQASQARMETSIAALCTSAHITCAVGG